MPSNLHRYQRSGQSHFITFSCYHKRQLLAEPVRRLVFEQALERVRLSFGLNIYGYVVMPDHVHLLTSEPRRHLLANALQSLKLGVSQRLSGNEPHFWQARYFDANLRDEERFREKLRYLHCNPVNRGLCARPEDWEWSSFLHYATGTKGRVEIESDWTARERERAAGRLLPLQT